MTEEADRSDGPDLIVRAPSPAEAGRAIFLFRNFRPPSGSWLFVALRQRPMSRLAAAGAIWFYEGIALFRMACQPGIPCGAVAGPLLMQLEEWARSRTANLIQCADLLPDETEWSKVLGEHGYHCLRSERFFHVPYHSAHERVTILLKRYEKDIPKTWRTESLRRHSPETVLDLVAQYRLLSPGELREHWRSDLPAAFELDKSPILFEGRTPIGILLLRRMADRYAVDVRVVTCQNPRLRALGNLCLFRHVSNHLAANEAADGFEFRGGETEHVETANLAFRMGGREVAQRRVFGKELQ